MNFRNFVLDIVFPRYCLGCNILLDDYIKSYICRSCLDGIKFNTGFACAFCKSPVVDGKTCPFCLKSHSLDRLLVTTSYENLLVEKILKSMKYRFIESLADDIADLMVKYLKNRLISNQKLDLKSTLITPVPLHTRRLNWRGFNQAENIVRKISNDLGLIFVTNVLKRIRNCKPQADMPDRQSRVDNMKNIFECNLTSLNPDSILGKTILLVDDISTTGSTLDDCARALKSAGAQEVIGFVFARGIFLKQ